MKKLLVLITLFVVGSFVMGCAFATSPMLATVYTDISSPLATEGSKTPYSKVGEAYAENYLGIVAVGDASLETAMKNGGITKIHHVDLKTRNILFLYHKMTIVVYGD